MPAPLPTESASSIVCRSASVTFGDKSAIHESDLAISTGQITSLIGPSGCGKTTLLRVLAGLQPLSSGDIVFDEGVSPQRGKVSFVFQQPVLLDWRTAIQNVVLPLELAGTGSGRSRRDDAIDVLQAVGLGDDIDRFPNELSGGMRMRVSIARALVTTPKLLLLDEPMAALDDMLRMQLGQLILSLWQQRQFTAVLVTHNVAEAVQLSHNVVVMRNGQTAPAITNPLPFPRAESLRREPEFGRFFGVVSDALRGVQ